MDINRKILKGTWYVDTLIYKVRSILGTTATNVYTNDTFVKVYPIKARREAGQSLIECTDDVGVPETQLTHGASDFTGRNTEF